MRALSSYLVSLFSRLKQKVAQLRTNRRVKRRKESPPT